MIQSKNELVNVCVELASLLILVGTITLAIWVYFALCALLGVPVD